MKAYFEDNIFSLTLTNDGHEAFESFKKSRPDVVIADLRMPIMNGFELADAIRKLETDTNLTKTPIILLTADALNETSEEALTHQVSLFLTKPIRKPQLLQAINNLVATSQK